MTVRILNSDCRAALSGMESESVNCIVTSPPYWGLRDYNVAGQMGLERSLGEHLEAMVAVFEECRRVLRKDGTCWINYGDCYAGGGRGGNPSDSPFRKQATNAGSLVKPTPLAATGLKPKDLCMIPNRLAIALQESGWWVRSEIVWAKPNPMPESIKDRPTTSHEKIWLLSKSQKYWFDGGAIKEPAKEEYADRYKYAFTGDGEGCGKLSREAPKGMRNFAELRNSRNVWTIATQSFSEAHFATFPPELAERCIKAGCPENGVVLDPFAGAGTTGLVADRLRRDAILIELNPQYCEMARRRIEGDAGIFAEVSAA